MRKVNVFKRILLCTLVAIFLYLGLNTGREECFGGTAKAQDVIDDTDTEVMYGEVQDTLEEENKADKIEEFYLPLNICTFGGNPEGQAIWVIMDVKSGEEFEVRTTYGQDIQLPFNGEIGVSKDIEVVNDPKEENDKIYRDERVWRVNVTPNQDGSVSINSQDYTMQGVTVGAQDSFIIKAPLQDGLYSEGTSELAKENLQQMTLEEKISQMFLVDSDLKKGFINEIENCDVGGGSDRRSNTGGFE